MYVDENTIYYLLSTLAQTYAAIIAVVGAISVFRYQRVLSLQESSWDEIEKDLLSLGCAAQPHSLTEDGLRWLCELDEERKECLKKKDISAYSNVMKEKPWLEMYREWLEKMRKSLKSYMIFHTGFIFACIFFIMFSTFLVSNKGLMFVILAILLAASLYITRKVYLSLLTPKPKCR